MTKPKKYPYLGEMLTVREALEKYGSEVQVEAIYSRMNKKGMSMYEAMTRSKGYHGRTRPAHHVEYCHQDGECREYSECGGDKYKKKAQCFVRERYGSGVQGISSVCSVNL